MLKWKKDLKTLQQMKNAKCLYKCFDTCIYSNPGQKKLCRLLRIQSRSYPVAAANNTETIYTKQIYKITAKKTYSRMLLEIHRKLSHFYQIHHRTFTFWQLLGDQSNLCAHTHRDKKKFSRPIQFSFARVAIVPTPQTITHRKEENRKNRSCTNIMDNNC